MNNPTTFQTIIRNKFTYLALILCVTFLFTLSSYPGKSCEQKDTLRAEAKKIENIEASYEPECDKAKEECKKFNMMSLNLVYYLMNKYISPKLDKE